MKHEEYGDFIIGNIFENSLKGALQSPKLNQIFRDIDAGLRKCSSTCAYFNACGGVAPSNKLYENGSFDSTETMFCRLTKQATVDIGLEYLEEKVSGVAKQYNIPYNPAEFVAGGKK